MAKRIANSLEVIHGKRVIAMFQADSAKGKAMSTVRVGYRKRYSLYVHENLAMKHKVGQAKFLEEPFRRMVHVMQAVVQRAVKNKDGLETGLKRAGNLLLQESLPLVPVDTGALKASGYVEVR